MSPYIKTLKVTSDIKKTATIVYFPDGSCMRLIGQGIQFYPNAKDFKGTKEVKDSGIKWFTFAFTPSAIGIDNAWQWASEYHYDKGFEPYKWSWNGDLNKLITDTEYGCNINNKNERAYCTALIQANGWKIPKDYPLKF